MGKVWDWTRNSLALGAVLAFGFWLGAAARSRRQAATPEWAMQFQLAGVSEASSLLVYQPETRTVYVYQGATLGNANVQCTYKFQMTRPGEVIRRVPCPVQELNP